MVVVEAARRILFETISISSILPLIMSDMGLSIVTPGLHGNAGERGTEVLSDNSTQVGSVCEKSSQG